MMPLPDMGDKHENPPPAYEESKTPELVHEAVEVTGISFLDVLNDFELKSADIPQMTAGLV